MSRTAVVILNYNGEALLRQFLPSVLKHSGSASIIVADNGSNDRSLQVLNDEFPGVTVIGLDKNYGFCGGYNKALKKVDADYFVLLNSDVEVTPEWLTPMIRLLDADPNIGAVQPKILSYHQKDTFEYAGAAGGFIDSLGYPFCRGRIFTTSERDNGQYNDEIPIFWATGACLLIRASIYESFGGLDEDFFAHMEEIDLCWKLQRANFKVYYCGGSTVYHLSAGTLGYANPRKTYLNFRNGLMLLIKHLDTGEVMYKVPARVALDWLAMFQYLIKGEPKHAAAIIKAHVHVVKAWNQVRRKRTLLRARFPEYSRKSIYPGLVLWSYFARGRKTYREIVNSPR